MRIHLRTFDSIRTLCGLPAPFFPSAFKPEHVSCQGCRRFLAQVDRTWFRLYRGIRIRLFGGRHVH